MTHHEDIRRRALLFATSGDWCNPNIISESDADSELVAFKGSGVATDYRLFRIEVDMRREVRERAIDLATQKDKSELETFLDGKWTMDITCSKTDVIDVNLPFVD